MSLFGLKFGNKSFDNSLTLRENISNTVLETITNSSYITNNGASSSQSLELDCSEVALAIIKAYSQNAGLWGPPPDAEKLSKLCSAENITQNSSISLNVTTSNSDKFADEISADLKNKFKQAEETIEDKNWYEMSGFNQNTDNSQNIKRIIENVTKKNIKEIVKETTNKALSTQFLAVKGVGQLKNVSQISTITLIASTINDAIFEGVDSLVLDKTVEQLSKTESNDAVSETIGKMFSDLTSAVSDTFKTMFSEIGSAVKTAVGSFAFVIFAVIAIVALALFTSPKLLCIPPASYVLPFCSSSPTPEQQMQ